MCRVVDLVNLVLESTAVSGLMFLFILIILTSSMFMGWIKSMGPR